MEYDRMVRAYQKIRQARKVLSEEFKANDSKLKSQLESIEAEFQREFAEKGVTSIKTEDGLVYQHTTTRANISDASAFYPWVRETDAFDMLQKRVSVKPITEYIEENGETPPGITLYREHQVRVRKA